MIKNFIFDCGNVLIAFSREHHLDVFVGQNESDRKLVFDAVFSEWNLQDKGMPSLDYYELVKKKLPSHLHQAAYNIIFHWKDEVWPVPGMEELVIRLKNKGYKLILLSDMPETFTYDHEFLSTLKYFDGLVFSYPLKIVKPDPHIFEYAMEKYDLKASESIFIDDRKENVEASIKLGMTGYQFDTNNPDAFIQYAYKIMEGNE